MGSPLANTIYNSPQGVYPGAAENLPRMGKPWRPGLFMSGDIGKYRPALTGQAVIRPRAFPWPYTQDSLGVAYPGGLVGLLFDGTSIDDQSSVTAWQANLVPVPSSPPAGYTANNDCGTWRGGQGGSIPQDVQSLLVYAQFARFGAYQPWLRGQSCYAIGGAILPLNYVDPQTKIPYYPRILLGNGLWDHLLGPCVQGQGFAGSTATSSQFIIEPTSVIPGTQADALGYVPIGAGCRNIRVFTDIQSSTMGVPTLTSCNLVIYRNSDWSQTGSHSTVVATIPASFTPAGTGVQTSQVDVSGFNVPDGVVGSVWVQIETVGNNAGNLVTIPAGGCTVGFSARVDIPYPWTVTSRYQGNDVIAVGGYKAGALASPNLRTPGVLTGTLTSFDPGIVGDDEWIIVSVTLTAGNYILSTGASWTQGFCAGPGGFYHSFASGTMVNAALPTDGQYVFCVIPNGVAPLPAITLQIQAGGTGDWSTGGGGD